MPTKKNDAITLLKKDHEKVRGLLDQLESANKSERRQRLLDEVETEIKIHSKIEEEIFYPAYKQAAETKEQRKLFFEAAEEHLMVDIMLVEIRNADPSSEIFAAKAKVLKDLVEHHAEEEEKEMFPAAKKLMEKEDLEALGQQMERRKESLQTQLVSQSS